MSGSRVTAARHRWEDWEAFSLVRHGHDGGGAEGGNCEDDGDRMVASWWRLLALVRIEG